MHDIKSNLYRCAHCMGVGTCKSGANGVSCVVCVKGNELKGKDYIGLPCAVCGGIGQAEPRTERINKRVAPLLALTVILPLVGGVFVSGILNSQHFSEILAFSGTLIGTILGFYFSSKSKAN